MSVYVGVDVHRKRSQMAVVTGVGQVQLNKNMVNGSEPMLRLAGLLEDYAFEAHLVPEAQLALAQVRQLRHRAGLVRLRTRQQNWIHAVAAGFGYDRSGSYLPGAGTWGLPGLLGDLPGGQGVAC